MTLAKPINPWHMVPNSAEFYVAKDWGDTPIQLGLYKDQELAPAGESIEDVYSNGVIRKTKDGNKITVNVDVHELTIEKLAIIQSGLVEVHPWTVSGEVESYMPWEWELNKGILLKYSNADWTAISPTSVKVLDASGTEQTLTADTDYTVGVNFFGATFIKLKVAESGGHLTSQSPLNSKLTITYSSANTTAKVMEHKANSLAEPFVMIIKNEFDYKGEKKSITTYLDNCQASKAMLQQISDNDNTTVGFPVEITGTIVKQDFVGFSMESESEDDGD